MRGAARRSPSLRSTHPAARATVGRVARTDDEPAADDGVPPGDALDHQAFTWRGAKDGTVFISWQGRVVTTVRGPEGLRLHAKLAGAEPRAVQLALAKATGHFKRGTER